MDSFGYAAKNSPLGKGSGGAAPGSPANPHADKTCDLCGRKGHIKSGCWYREGGEKGPDKMPKNRKGTSKGLGRGNGKGDRQRGSDGRWYKKSGINS